MTSVRCRLAGGGVLSDWVAVWALVHCSGASVDGVLACWRACGEVGEG